MTPPIARQRLAGGPLSRRADVAAGTFRQETGTTSRVIGIKLELAEFVVMTVRPVASRQQRRVVAPARRCPYQSHLAASGAANGMRGSWR
jgi:hypothetical protein